MIQHMDNLDEEQSSANYGCADDSDLSVSLPELLCDCTSHRHRVMIPFIHTKIDFDLCPVLISLM